MTFPSLWKSSPSSFTPHLSHSIFPSQSSHLLYQRLCTHTFLLPSSPLALPHCYLFFSPTPVPLFVVVFFFHTLLLSHLCTLFFPLPLVSLSLFLRVISQVDWPLNIIITDSCMNKYNRLFSFLLQLKHMVWSLREVWFHLKRTGERVEAFDPGPTRSPPHCKEGRVKILPVVLQRL